MLFETDQVGRGVSSSQLRGRVVLVVKPSPDSFLVVAQVRRPWAGVLARLRAQRLDAELSAGYPPDASQLHSIRAETLVSPRYRSALAKGWENLLVTARRPRSPRDPRPPIARMAIAAAEREIVELVVLLRCFAPVPPQGVAMAKLLLTDGSGPVYESVRRAKLKEAVSATIRGLQLD